MDRKICLVCKKYELKTRAERRKLVCPKCELL